MPFVMSERTARELCASTKIKFLILMKQSEFGSHDNFIINSPEMSFRLMEE